MTDRAAVRDQKITAGERQGLRNQLAELAGTNDQHAVAGTYGELILDGQRGGQRLDEDGRIRGDLVGDTMKVRER